MNKIKIKVLVVGSAACGKSALLQMYTTNNEKYPKDYLMTQIGEVYSKIISFPDDDKDIELFLFEIGGQEVYQSVNDDLLSNAKLCIYTFDSTNPESFKNLTSYWVEKVKKCNSGINVPGIIVSTKNDYRELKAVDYQEAQNFARQMGMEYFETSAARNIDIEKPFEALAKIALKNRY